jgi:flagella basal body P-ring formation protein FlgA
MQNRLLLGLLLLSLLSPGGAQAVSDTPASYPRSAQESALTTALASTLAADSVAVFPERALGVLEGDGPLAVATLDVDANRQTFTATLKAGVTEQVVTGRFSHLVQVAVPVRDLVPGDVIAAEDLAWLGVDEKAVNSRILAEPEQLVGLEVRRPLRADKLVLARDVRAPRLIAKGDLVTVALQTPVMNLTLQGRALNDAGMHEPVRVLNLSSKKTIDGVVSGPRAVTIGTAVAGMPVVASPVMVTSAQPLNLTDVR